MKTASFVTALNGLQNPLPWLLDSSNTNNGFPILTGMPGSINFIHQSDVPLNSWIVSNPVTVTGFGNPASISISPGGEYSVSGDGGSTWSDFSTTIPATIGPNQQIKVRQTSSGDPLTSTSITLSIGGVNAAFDVTTAAAGDPNATGLVAWWKGENNAYDSVGGNHGSWIGTPAYSAGQVGQAFSFNGTDDSIGVGMLNNTALNETMPFSIATWINTSDTSPYQTIASNYMGEAGGTGNYSTYLNINAGELVFGLNQRQVIDDSISTGISTGWHFVTATYDGSALNLYLDGVLKNSTVRHFSGSSDNTRGWYIGNYPPDWVAYIGSNTSFDGLIDELKIYNRPLSPSEISKLAGTYPDPFSFTPETDAELSTQITSESIPINGLTNPASISISLGGEYEINGDGQWLSTSSTINPSSTVRVRLTSSSGFGTTTTATLNIGGREGTFSVTTLADIVKPVVTGFSLAVTESINKSIGVTTFTANDNDRVSGYLITTSSTPPPAADPGWSATVPATFTLPSAGLNTLYAWAKDPVGNVSEPLTDTVLLKPVRRGTSTFNYYESISSAYSAASSGETISSLAVTVPGSVTITGKSLTIKGGYADEYGSQPGVTTIQGVLTIGTGSLTVDRVAVK
jgi:hypothetical protein